jgi:hypothetical protein
MAGNDADVAFINADRLEGQDRTLGLGEIVIKTGDDLAHQKILFLLLSILGNGRRHQP